MVIKVMFKTLINSFNLKKNLTVEQLVVVCILINQIHYGCLIPKSTNAGNHKRDDYIFSR